MRVDHPLPIDQHPFETARQGIEAGTACLRKLLQLLGRFGEGLVGDVQALLQQRVGIVDPFHGRRRLVDDDALGQKRLHQDGDGRGRIRHLTLRIAEAADRLVDFRELLLKAEIDQRHGARQVDLAEEVGHPAQIRLVGAAHHLGNELLCLAEAAAIPAIVDAMLLAMQVGHVGEPRIETFAFRLFALEHVGSCRQGIDESDRVVGDALVDVVERVVALRRTIGHRSVVARQAHHRRVLAVGSPHQRRAQRHRRQPEQGHHFPRGVAHAERRARDLQVDGTDAVVDMQPSPLLHARPLDAIELARDLLGGELGRRRVGRVRRLDHDGIDGDAAHRQLAYDRGQHDDDDRAHARGHQDLAQAVEPIG